MQVTDSSAVQLPHRSSSFTKRLLDVTLSVSALIGLLPVMLTVAILVKLSSPGPILYRRTVQGYRGRPFAVLKFRSMIQNAHELMKTDPQLFAEYQRTLKIANDPRITPIGRILRKTSLDELPQLINVIRGDMSLVGPRMLGDIELEKYGEWRSKVLGVKPGITGLWQISGRHRTSFEERVRLDMYYIDHWSLVLDLVILLKTPFAVIGMAGAH